MRMRSSSSVVLCGCFCCTYYSRRVAALMRFSHLLSWQFSITLYCVHPRDVFVWNGMSMYTCESPASVVAFGFGLLLSLAKLTMLIRWSATMWVTVIGGGLFKRRSGCMRARISCLFVGRYLIWWFREDWIQQSWKTGISGIIYENTWYKKGLLMLWCWILMIRAQFNLTNNKIEYLIINIYKRPCDWMMVSIFDDASSILVPHKQKDYIQTGCIVSRY